MACYSTGIMHCSSNTVCCRLATVSQAHSAGRGRLSALDRLAKLMLPFWQKPSKHLLVVLRCMMRHQKPLESWHGKARNLP